MGGARARQRRQAGADRQRPARHAPSRRRGRPPGPPQVRVRRDPAGRPRRRRGCVRPGPAGRRSARRRCLPWSPPWSASRCWPGCLRCGPPSLCPHEDAAPRVVGSCSAPAQSPVAPSCVAGAGQWIIRARNKISDIVLPKARQPLPALPAGLEEKYDGISSFVTPAGELLPGRHQPDRPRRRRRLVVAHRRRRRRQEGLLHLRRAAADGRGRARHHADLRQQRGRRQPRRVGPLARRTPADVLDRPASAAPGPTRSSAPPSTASRSAPRCRSRWTGATRCSPSG